MRENTKLWLSKESGDSVGPLICADEENQPVVVGVTSWGFGCAEPNSPGVWTKVSSYID
ncbi:unnamed protein product [Oikopleura dioica]|uniref:Peptidase S1 domain-containing protein n=1 Tax=Oikopleura dioica TaxID=34765 RepID=E4XDX5_OIKDI|nr:unnamed protein product [Oikopleura dioica]